MNLLKKEIIDWYWEYQKNNEKENKYENDIIRSIKIGDINTWEDFKSLLFRKYGILYWKGALRTKHYYECLDLDSSKWVKLFEIIKISKDGPRDIVKKIVSFSRNNMNYNGKRGGISYPVASTLVYFFSKGESPVIDWRAISALKDNGYDGRLKNIYTDDGWDRYFDLCENLVKNLEIEKIGEDTPLRVLDKALWEYPDLNKAERKKEVCC